jgi:hypothetical protein
MSHQVQTTNIFEVAIAVPLNAEQEELVKAPESEVIPEKTSRDTVHEIRKITSNSYNRGDVEFEEFKTSVTLDSHYANTYLQEYKDSFEYQEHLELQEHLYSFWQIKWEKLVGFEKISKRKYEEIYIECLEYTNGKYSNIDIFTNLAEFLNTNIAYFYEALSPLLKEPILSQLQAKSNRKEKIKSARLF